jgi:hypothetical protein
MRKSYAHPLRRNKGSIDIEILALIIVLLISMSPWLLKFVGISAVYSEGQRTGTIMKVSKKGFLWKTWEGEILLGGVKSNGDGETVPASWEFTIPDDELAKQGVDLADKGSRVTVTYKELWKTTHWQGATDYMVTELKP